jgi:UDP-galactose transporter B1
VFINACQSLSSCLAALVYLVVKRRSVTTGGALDTGLYNLVGWDQVFPPSPVKSAVKENGHHSGGVKPASRRKTLLALLLQVSAFQTCASPIGFASLKYISYPMMVLAKVCLRPSLYERALTLRLKSRANSFPSFCSTSFFIAGNSSRINTP